MAEGEDDLIETLASSITRRGLTTPAMVLLELVKPLSFLLSQALLVTDPLLSPLAGGMGRRWAWLLEDRLRIDGLLETLASHRPTPLPSTGKEDECNPSPTQ